MGFLKEYEARYAADARKALLFEWITNRRNELFKELRAQAPILQFPDFEKIRDSEPEPRSLFLVSRYQDVRDVITNEQHFNVAPYRDAGSQNFILGMDSGQAHDEGRALLEQGIQREDEETIRDIVAKEAEAATKAALSRGSLNLPADFARLIPLKLVARYFGVPGPDLQTLGNWTLALARAFTYRMFTRYFIQDLAREKALAVQALQAREQFGAYLSKLITEGEPGKDTVLGRIVALRRNSWTQLSSEDREKDITHLIRLMIGTINGMIENINMGVNKTMNGLLSRPDALVDAIAAAQKNDEKLLSQYIWEALRFDVPVPPLLPRDCYKEYVLAQGTPRATIIPEGARVFAALCSAMLDEEQVKNPPAEKFCPGRSNDPYLHFGAGLHNCLGRHVAEVQLVEMFKPLLRLPGIRRALGPAGELRYDGLLPTSFILVYDRPSLPRTAKRGPMPQPAESRQPVQTPLTAIMTIKSPQDVHYRALQMLLNQVFPRVKALLDKVGTVHFARFVFLDNNTKLALITTYDGSFENYIKNYIELAGNLFDRMLEHMKDAPPLPVRKYRDEFVEYVRRIDVESAVFYSSYPTSTVQDIRAHGDGTIAQPRRTLEGDAIGQGGNDQKQETTIIPLTEKDWPDIQGLILRNYHMPRVRHFILRINQACEAQQFIDGLVNSRQGYPQITTADKEWPKGQAPAYCLNIGFTYAGLKALELPDSSLASFASAKAFVAGAVARAPEVGDSEENAPDRWDPSLRKTDKVHVLLSLYAREEKELQSYTNDLETLFTQHALTLLSPPYEGKSLGDGRIHFGYKDGISQPIIAGAPKPEFPDSQPPVPPGAFLLGYPSQWQDFRYPVPRPTQLGRNGSFMAFRVLEQDVEAFEQYLKDTVQQLKKTYGIDMNEEKVAAKICGRWRNGVPLTLSPDPDATKIPKEQWNNFTYTKDQEGYGCPFGAHMRRTHPRKESEKVAGVDGHQRRIIRRGMPYGLPYKEAPEGKRGLLGLFICASLEDQFEFLMANWINRGGFRAGVPTGATDPLFGSNDQESTFFIPTKERLLSITGFQQFVTTRGGAYCFLPSITALRYIAELPTV